MKLYVVCPTTSRRIYLSIVAEKRSQIEEWLTVKCPFEGGTHTFNREQVEAEPTFGASVGGAVIGGLIGAVLAGPLGAILGGGAGLFMGSSAEDEERRRVRNFYEG